MNTELMFSSVKQDWTTPDDLFQELNKEFLFSKDVAANHKNAKCAWYFTEEDNGLLQEWSDVNFCNPPYKTSKLWIKKAYEESLNGKLTVMLIPARTDTVAFHTYIYNKPNVEIRFLKGRLKFGNSKNPAPFPSMIVIFRPNEATN